jgi:hypothetical protein
VASYEELNAWLLDRCVAHAKAHKHPELTDRTHRCLEFAIGAYAARFYLPQYPDQPPRQ